MQFPVTLVQLAEKPPSPQVACGQTVKFFQTIFISCNFQQIWFSWKKSPLTHLVAKKWKFLDWIYPFHAISSNFGSAGRKAPLPIVDRQWKFFRLDLSISCNFQWLWFSWQKNLPQPAQQTDSENFLDWIYSCHAISSNFGTAGREAPQQPDSENSLDWIYPFHAFSSNFGSAGRKVPTPSGQTMKNF